MKYAIILILALSACAGGSHEPTRFAPNLFVTFDISEGTK